MNAIIVSSQDKAGLNIKKRLLEMFDFSEEGKFEGEAIYKKDDTRLYTTQEDSVFCENIDEEIEADLFVFATKHESRSGIPSLCVHTQGNWGSADFGGRPKTLGICPACYLKKALIHLDKNSPEDYDVIQEVTHHGPFMEKPSFFIEIGSDEERWQDRNAAKIIAETIMHVIGEDKRCRSAVGIGGLHHTPNFKKIILETDIAMGHICPKYQLENLDIGLVNQAIQKTIPYPEMVILDWKGLSGFKNKMRKIIKKIPLPVKRTNGF